MKFTDRSAGDVRGPVAAELPVRCAGPDKYGQCPDPDEGLAHACVGHRVASMNAGPEYWLVGSWGGLRALPARLAARAVQP